MSIEIIHVSDIHFGSGEVHGRVNPETGLNIRFEDFVRALEKTVDYAIANNIDVFLFSGDAYRNASPEPIYQKMFASELKRLSNHGIKTILVVGNHDQILKSTSSHAMSVFQSLEVPGVITVDKPASFTLDTANGAVQIVGLPHITRHQLMTLEKYSTLSHAQLDRVLIEHVKSLLHGFYDELDPTIPTVATAHMSLDSALAGIEQELLIGYTLTFPAEMFMDSRIDYVALGHIHKHQVLRDAQPAIVYAGSLERVDFGEEREDKGFVHVSVSRGQVKHKFVSIEPRPFVTIDADLTDCETPTETLCAKVKKARISNSVTRIRYKIKQEQLAELNEDQIRTAAGEVLSVRLIPEIVASQSRARLPQLTESCVTSPLQALDTYLGEVAADKKEQLLEKAKSLITELNEDLHSCN